jgi:DNA-binding transcriptional LysR family regulator
MLASVCFRCTHKQIILAANVRFRTVGLQPPRIAQLEHQLGKALFDRTAKGWVITPIGEKVVALAEEMANQAIAIHREIKSDSENVSGLINI